MSGWCLIAALIFGPLLFIAAIAFEDWRRTRKLNREMMQRLEEHFAAAGELHKRITEKRLQYHAKKIAEQLLKESR